MAYAALLEQHRDLDRGCVIRARAIHHDVAVGGDLCERTLEIVEVERLGARNHSPVELAVRARAHVENDRGVAAADHFLQLRHLDA